MKNVGILITALGSLVALFVAYNIYQDMTGAFFRYAYGTTGHPEKMTPHEIGNLVFLALGVGAAIVGGTLWKRATDAEAHDK